jgi:hypothetical protein
MIEAGFNATCACGATITEGDEVGYVDGELCCDDCVKAFGEDPIDPAELFGEATADA